MKDLCSDREVRLKFVVEAGKTLQTKCTPVSTYLNTYGANLARSFDSSLPACWTKKNLVCLYCLTPWNRDKYSLGLRPTVKPGKKIKYILRKLEKNRNCSFIEKKLAAKVHTGNRIVLKCCICSKATPFLINKGQGQTTKVVNQNQTKKKKRKDPLAGLSPAIREVVIELNKKNDKKSKQVFRSGINGVDDVKVVGNTDIITDGEAILEKKASKGDPLYDQTDSNKGLCSSTARNDGSRLRIEAPLGRKLTQFDSGSGADSFIPLISASKKEGKLNPGSKGSFRSQEEKPTKFINPFAATNQNRSKKKQRKRVDHLQQIIAEEKNKSKGKSSSFKDFLTLV